MWSRIDAWQQGDGSCLVQFGVQVEVETEGIGTEEASQLEQELMAEASGELLVWLSKWVALAQDQAKSS